VHALEGGRVFGDEGVQVVLRKMDSAPLDITIFLQEKDVYFTSRFGFEHLGGCILIDGSIGSYTAALDQDYEGQRGERGQIYEKARELIAFVAEAHQAGCQLAFHAIGPRAIELVLRAYERALARWPRWDHRHRIEHFELATDDQIRRAADLGVVVSMQPAFEHFWGGPHGMYANRLGERWRLTNRLRSCLDAGLVVAGGSDTNVTPAEPLLGIAAAVAHPNDEQRVSPEEALRMFTWAAAYAAFNEKRHGSISPGKEASFTVLDRDITHATAEQIRETRVLSTWHEGRRIWQAPEQ
jgi:predicted amidohydrolase YtcJ